MEAVDVLMSRTGLWESEKMWRATNVRDVELSCTTDAAAAAAACWPAAVSASSISAASRSSAEVAASGWSGESRLRFAILSVWIISITRQERRSQAGCATYLANIDESTHEVLVAECCDCLLGLFPRCVFHNPGQFLVLFPSSKLAFGTYPHPYKTRGPGPIRQS